MMSPKVAIAQINSIIGDFTGNRNRIVECTRRAITQGADIVLTPELSLTGYPLEDLLLRPGFHDATQRALQALTQELASLGDVYVLVGHPFIQNGNCFNACSVLFNGTVVGTYCKHDLPNYGVFDEKRYFSPGNTPFVFTVKGVCFGINICEDIWSTDAPERTKMAGAQVLLVSNGSPYRTDKLDVRQQIARDNVTSQGLALLYANMVGGQDELVFDGNSFVLNQDGVVCVQMKHCEEDLEVVTFEGSRPLQGSITPPSTLPASVYQALVLGVRDYIGKNGFSSVLIGLSGGVDSALVLAVAVDALGADKVRAIMMPSEYTADISLIDARDMANRVNVKYDEIPIENCFNAFLNALSEQFAGLPEDASEENIQARIRGTLLMAMSNKFGSIVLTTGNKSEMAVGYCTLYGDMAGGFAVLKDVPKTLVYQLCQYRNTLSDIIPERIITRAPSAELKADQKDQDTLPPYDILDEIIRLFMEEKQKVSEIVAQGYEQSLVERILNMIRINEYKRRQAPPGILITSCGFGRDWRYPITSKYRD